MGDIFTGEITRKKFIHFVWPSVLMMEVIALYYGMDSVLVANLLGEEAMAALSVSYPVEGIMWGVSIMLASGSSAIVAIKMGEGKQEEANEKFTSICVLSAVIGIIFIAGALIFIDQIIDFLGATESIRGYCKEFLTILPIGFPAAFIGVIFEYFIRVDGHPAFTLFLYVIGGIVHLGLAFLLMGPLDMGLAGTAWANVGGLVAVMVVGGAYFVFADTKLKFRKFRNDWRFIGHCFANGSSEMVSESSAGITTFFFNMVIIKLTGEVGIAAGSAVLNIHYFIISIFIGYVMGVAPLISYFYGAKEYEKLNKVIDYSRKFIIVTSIISAAVCLIFSNLIVLIYADPGSKLYELATVGVRFLAPALLLGGVNIFASGFFTAYGNGVVSALISALRALIMIIIGMFLLSWLFGMTGIWLTLTFAEIMTLGLTFKMFGKYKDVYHYRLGVGKL